MVKLEQIIEYWKKDGKIDESKPHLELINTPILHGKYVEILSQHRLAAQKAKFDYSKMKKIRREYYLGNLDKETLDENNWEQFDLKIGTKGNIDLYLESDDHLIKLLEKKAYYEECIFICESILKELHSRTFQLKEYCTHQRFLQGSY
jgi:hypothetical protein